MASRTRPILIRIALNSPSLAPTAQILQTFAERYPIDSVPEKITEKDGTAVFPIADGQVAISLVPTPIPWSSLEGPCDVAWWWPEARQRMQEHKAHAILAMIDHSGSAVERHVLLTQMAAAVVANADVAGIYWTSGGVVHSPEALLTLSAALSPDNLLPELWIDMRLVKDPQGAHQFFTTGMEAFGHREIEIPCSHQSAEEIYGFVYGVIKYVLSSDQFIRDGETIGRSVEEKIEVGYGPSMLGQNRQVMTLAFG